jgi:glyoxylase-like metal-dependent hydrolase (beta-lactamase superfamily II)
MFAGQVALLTYQAGTYFATGQVPRALGNAHPIVCPYDTTAVMAYYVDAPRRALIDTGGAEHPHGAIREGLRALGRDLADVATIVNTHGHWDHTADNTALVRATGAPLCAHSWDATRLANPTLATEDEPALPVPPSKADRGLQDGSALSLGELEFQVIHTPGHTPGSICLYERTAGVIFTGDTLYRTGVGRTNFPGGDPNALNKSLRRLAELPDNTRVYPGHGLSTTIGRERWLLDLAG